MRLLHYAKGLGAANLERLALGAILLFAAGLRLWGIGQNGFANTYYAAAVRSMTLSLHNFLYLSFDPAGFVSVDKPPFALWIQVASAKLFGFTPLSLLWPQAFEGIGWCPITWCTAVGAVGGAGPSRARAVHNPGYGG